MSSPRHSPPPSAAAPKPRGILKNTGSATAVSPGLEAARDEAAEEGTSHLAWDESNLTLHEIQREQQDPRMKIDEPKTPFVRSASFSSVDDDTNFNLDGQGGDGVEAASASAPRGSYFEAGDSGDAQVSADGDYVHPSTSPARRSSAAEVLAANTKANANLAAAAGGTAAGTASGIAPAVGLDSADLAQQQQQSGTSSRSSSRRGNDSRSPSFTLPSSRRSSAAGDRSRDGVREEMRSRTDEGDTVMNGVEGAIEDDDRGPLDPEEKAKHDAFARKRNAHYGKEAEAMKIAAALAARDEEDDEE